MEDNGEGELTKTKETNTLENAVEVANVILLDADHQTDKKIGDINLYKDIESKLQATYKDHYEHSGLKEEIAKLKGTDNPDDAALKVITEAANKGEGGWTATFPNLRTEGQGMDCTLATAMLHMALDDLGYTDARSTLRHGHYVTTRTTENGEVKLYDPATTVTKNGITSGYSRTFAPNEVVITEVDERNGKKGKLIQITSTEQDMPGGFQEASSDGNYKQRLYAHPRDTYLNASVALENIDSMKKDARSFEDQRKESGTEHGVWQTQAQQIVSSHPEIAQFDYAQLKSKLGFFDPHTVLDA